MLVFHHNLSDRFAKIDLFPRPTSDQTSVVCTLYYASAGSIIIPVIDKS